MMTRRALSATLRNVTIALVTLVGALAAIALSVVALNKKAPAARKVNSGQVTALVGETQAL
jgi:hypothetical protein